MTYTASHGLLTILGDAFTASEIWQTGIRLIGTSVPTNAQFQAIDAAVENFLDTPQLAFPQGRRYLGLKWAPQDVNGRYGDDGESVEWFRSSPFSGTAGQGYPQIALVLSLRTARARGYASNGRMYFPSSATISPDDGRMDPGNAQTVATAGAALIAGIRQAGPGNPAVMSTVGSGRTEPVTGVRVGRVLDTQRRRRNGLDEAYGVPVEVPL